MGSPKPVSVNFATGLTNVRYEDPFTATNLVATLPPLVQSRATCDVRTGNADDRQRHDRTRCRTLRRGPSRTIVVAGLWKSHTGLCSRAHPSEGRASDLGTPGLLRPLVVEERRGAGRRLRPLVTKSVCGAKLTCDFRSLPDCWNPWSACAVINAQSQKGPDQNATCLTKSITIASNTTTISYTPSWICA